jgi:hypothetical protein
LTRLNSPEVPWSVWVALDTQKLYPVLFQLQLPRMTQYWLATFFFQHLLPKKTYFESSLHLLLAVGYSS